MHEECDGVARTKCSVCGCSTEATWLVPDTKKGGVFFYLCDLHASVLVALRLQKHIKEECLTVPAAVETVVTVDVLARVFKYPNP